MPASLYDLHIHTCFSDGKYKPEQVMQEAKRLGLSAVAFTDHDLVRGFMDAQFNFQPGYPELIPGIEITTLWDVGGARQEVDLLGYYIDPFHSSILEYEKIATEDMRAFSKKCCDGLTSLGMVISFQDVAARFPHGLGPISIAQTLLQKGYLGDWDQAVRQVLSFWETSLFRRLSIAAAIAMIHKAGGVAVLAHPALISCGDGWLQEEEIAYLVKCGLDGLEVYHPRMSETSRRHFSDLAHRFNLLVTGGSDLHGWFEDFSVLASQPVTTEMMAALRERAAHRHQMPGYATRRLRKRRYG